MLTLGGKKPTLTFFGSQILQDQSCLSWGSIGGALFHVLMPPEDGDRNVGWGILSSSPRRHIWPLPDWLPALMGTVYYLCGQCCFSDPVYGTVCCYSVLPTILLFPSGWKNSVHIHKCSSSLLGRITRELKNFVLMLYRCGPQVLWAGTTGPIHWEVLLLATHVWATKCQGAPSPFSVS